MRKYILILSLAVLSMVFSISVIGSAMADPGAANRVTSTTNKAGTITVTTAPSGLRTIERNRRTNDIGYRWNMVCEQTENRTTYGFFSGVYCSNNWKCTCKSFTGQNQTACNTTVTNVSGSASGPDTSAGRNQCIKDAQADADAQIDLAWKICIATLCVN